jgi:hypothetical protein
VIERLDLSVAARSGRSHALRLGVFFVVLIALSLVPWRVSPEEARTVGVAILALAALATGVVGLVVRRLQRHLVGLAPRPVRDGLAPAAAVARPLVQQSWRTIEFLSNLIRRVGLTFLGLGFVALWTAVILLIWSSSPEACSPLLSTPCHGAYRGLGVHPEFGQVFTLALQAAFGHRPASVLPSSLLAETAETTELITGLLVLSAYAGAFYGLGSARSHSPAD